MGCNCNIMLPVYWEVCFWFAYDRVVGSDGSQVNMLSLMLFLWPGAGAIQIFIMMMVTSHPEISANHRPVLCQVIER